jgi:hypothetical protein
MHETVLLSCQTCTIPSVYQSLNETDFLMLNHMIRQIFCYDLRKEDLHKVRSKEYRG